MWVCRAICEVLWEVWCDVDPSVVDTIIAESHDINDKQVSGLASLSVYILILYLTIIKYGWRKENVEILYMFVILFVIVSNESSIYIYS